jgi:hypothetical protein
MGQEWDNIGVKVGQHWGKSGTTWGNFGHKKSSSLAINYKDFQ